MWLASERARWRQKRAHSTSFYFQSYRRPLSDRHHSRLKDVILCSQRSWLTLPKVCTSFRQFSSIRSSISSKKTQWPGLYHWMRLASIPTCFSQRPKPLTRSNCLAGLTGSTLKALHDPHAWTLDALGVELGRFNLHWDSRAQVESCPPVIWPLLWKSPWCKHQSLLSTVFLDVKNAHHLTAPKTRCQ